MCASQVFAESGGSVSIAWKRRLMDEKKQNAEEMRASIQSVRDRHQYNLLHQTLDNQSAHDDVFKGQYVNSAEANVVLSHPFFDPLFRFFTASAPSSSSPSSAATTPKPPRLELSDEMAA